MYIRPDACFLTEFGKFKCPDKCSNLYFCPARLKWIKSGFGSYSTLLNSVN